MKNIKPYLREVLKVYNKLHTKPQDIDNTKVLIESLTTTSLSFFISILISIIIFLFLY